MRLVLDYPYDVADTSFAYVGGRTLPLVGLDLASPPDCEVIEGGRTTTLGDWVRRRRRSLPEPVTAARPLLAYGANASLQGLARKLGTRGPAAVVPVARAVLVDVDVVYSAHLSPYGAIPAALARCPGARVRVHVLVATDAQRAILAGTEPNYVLTTISDVDLRLDLGPGLTEIDAYLSRHGLLGFEGSPVALAAVPAAGRCYPAMSEPEVLALARDRLAPGIGLEDFVTGHVGDPGLAERRSRQLRSGALPAQFSGAAAAPSATMFPENGG